MHVSVFARAGTALAVGCLVLSWPSAAGAATTSDSSDEVGGSTVAAHTTAQNLRSTWASRVSANGGTPAPPIALAAPRFSNGSAVTGVINTASDGTTTSVARTRYTTGAAPTLVGTSSTPGTATCTTSGTSLQGGAPRPTSMLSNSTCSTSSGFAYSEVGGAAAEGTTRDAVEFTFSRPVLGFGAWFGDLETRTDGRGVAALVRLYGAGGVLLSSRTVAPGPTYLPQTSCNNDYTGCGNNTTRWLSFVADPAQPVLRMVVIVGDEDSGGTAEDEGMSFIGPTLDLSTARIGLAKAVDPPTDTNGDGRIGAGDTLTYRFVVTNTGSLPETGVAVTDPNATGLTCPTGSVAPGAAVTCSGSHVLTQAQVDAGSLSNTATASATVYGGSVTSGPSTAVVTLPSNPVLELVKTVDEPTFADVGDVLHFHVTATNAGNVTLRGLSVLDPAPGAGAVTSTCPAVTGQLTPGSSASCAVTYTVTQADLDNGSVTNNGSGSATTPSDARVGPVSATATSSAVQQVGLGLTKAVDETTYDAVGDVLTYTLNASNTGNVTLTGVTVSDPPPGPGAYTLDCRGLPATLAPDAQGRCTARYTVTQSDLDAGAVTNQAGAEAVGPQGPVAAPEAEVASTVLTRPGLSLVKTVDEDTYDAVGDVLTYAIAITNTSNVTVHDVTVEDEAPGAGAFALDCSRLPATLAPRAGGTCAATYTVTQSDLDNGSVVNAAQGAALLPTNAAVRSAGATAGSTAQQSASLSLVKAAVVADYDSVGDVVTFTIDVSNPGNVTLDDVEVTDPAPGDGAFTLDCSALPSTLAPGEVGDCTAAYTVTQADLDAGSVTNAATADATAPSGTVSAPESQATATAQQEPMLTAEKSMQVDTYDEVGDVLVYTITVSNAGNVTLTGVSVSDPAPGSGAFALDCSLLPPTLGPGESGACDATYTVTQADLDSGSVTNVASTEATAPSGPVTASDATATATAVQAPSLTVVKTVDADSYDDVGDVLTYRVTVSNSGNVTVTGVSVSDLAPGVGAFALDCSSLPGVLPPGAVGECAATYAVTQADIDSGAVTNIATANGTSPAGPVRDSSPPVTTPAEQSSALAVAKIVDTDTYDQVGDVLTYAITVENQGNVRLTAVDVDDDAPGTGAFILDCADLPATLPRGATGTCTATYAVTQADIDAGTVRNTARATATDARGAPVASVDVSVAATALITPALTVVKTVDADSYDEVGDLLTYAITVSNSGNVTLTGVSVSDPAPGEGAFALDCSGLPAVLGPEAAGTCTASYAVTQADLDNREVTNTATATGTAPTGPVSDTSRPVTTTAARSAALTVVKTVDSTDYDEVGDVLTYRIAVTNRGNQTLTGVRVVDDAPGAGAFALDCAPLPATLAPDAAGTCTATYAVTQADLDAGTLVNTARALGTSPGGDVVRSADASAGSTALLSPSLSLVKTVRVDTYDEVGDVLDYRITVTNLGNTTLTDVDVRDPRPGTGAFDLDCAALPATLGPDAAGTCAATYTVTQADLDAGSVTNVATADATSPSGPVAAPDAEATARTHQGRSLAVTKTVDAHSYLEVGDVLTYAIGVTNTGGVTLRHVAVSDRPPGQGRFSTTCGTIARLAPGRSSDCSASYTVTAGDLTRDRLTNTASATAAGLAAVSASATSTPVESGGGTIPNTGAPPYALPLGLAGLLLVVAGTVLLIGQRRRRHPGSHEHA